MSLLHEMESASVVKAPRCRLREIESPKTELPALPASSSDPLEAFETVGKPIGTYIDDYWSASASFWSKWKSDEASIRRESLEKAKSSLAESQKEAATAAAALARDAEKERQDQEKMKETKRKEEMQKKPAEASKAQIPDKKVEISESPSALMARFDSLMEEGKQFRLEFVQIWREISLAVSTTAGNARSIQLNGAKLISLLSKTAIQAGSNRPSIPAWMAAVCGSKIVSQASSGNKVLVWSFAYLARIVSEKFPDVIRLGVLAQLLKDGGHVSAGISGVDTTCLASVPPKHFEMYTRLLIALLCVCGDESSIWGWVARCVNQLRSCKRFLSSNEAMWSMMKLFVFLDMGLHDFRRMFGSKTSWVISALETQILPALDAEIQSVSGSTSTSVQFKYYLDACWICLQERKYLHVPEGQILSASKETDLNPEL